MEDHTFVPEKIVTDQLGSYEAALKQIPALEMVKHVFVKSEARKRTTALNAITSTSEKSHAGLEGGAVHRTHSRLGCGAGRSRGTCSKRSRERRERLESTGKNRFKSGVTCWRGLHRVER
jgi:transposase-like protein